jgi:hypothetical protein
LSTHGEDEGERERISRHLNSDYPSHSYPIMLREAKRIGLKAVPMADRLNDLLIALNALYSEMGQRALTDYDELNYHDNEILNIIEGSGVGFNYQNDKDWHYRKEERRWVPMNDHSSWRRFGMKGGKVVLKNMKSHTMMQTMHMIANAKKRLTQKQKRNGLSYLKFQLINVLVVVLIWNLIKSLVLSLTH